MVSVGIIEGSSVMGLTKAEYEALTLAEKKARDESVARVYLEAGADAVVQDIRGILDLVE